MKTVAIESPYAGDVDLHLAYLKAALRDALSRGEAPFASHGLYPGALDDGMPGERELGIRAGFQWSRKADVRVFYLDLGWSSGMRDGHKDAVTHGQLIEYRTVPGWES